MLKETISLIRAITGKTYQPVCFKEPLSIMPQTHAHSDAINIYKVQTDLDDKELFYMDDGDRWLAARHPDLIQSIHQHLKEAFMGMFSELQDYILQQTGGRFGVGVKTSTHVYGPDGYIGHIEGMKINENMQVEVFIGKAKALSIWKHITEADTYIVGRLWQVLCQTENRKLCTV